jgi:hypothetical protein
MGDLDEPRREFIQKNALSVAHGHRDCDLADLDADEYDETRSGLWTRSLLIRRNISDGDLAFFTTWCLAGTGIQTLVAVQGHRWAIDDSFETANDETPPKRPRTRTIRSDPLVDSGSPTDRQQACPASYPARPHHRLVMPEAGTSSRRQTRSSQV